MSLATLAYVPNIPRLFPDSFLRNMRAYKTEYPVIFYSCSKQEGMELIPDPTPIKSSKNKVAIHNLVFLAGLKIAQDKGIKRFLYMELDTRVGCDYWDKLMFDEAEQHRDMFVAGTPACYNYKAMTPAHRAYTDEYLSNFKNESSFEVAHFPAKTIRPLGCVFIMGSGAIYNCDVMSDLFMGYERDAQNKASKTPAFDLFIGLRCVQLFGVKAANKLPYLTKSFSTYSNKLTTEKERIEMLKSGRAALIHQVKSNTDCL